LILIPPRAAAACLALLAASAGAATDPRLESDLRPPLPSAGEEFSYSVWAVPGVPGAALAAPDAPPESVNARFLGMRYFRRQTEGELRSGLEYRFRALAPGPGRIGALAVDYEVPGSNERLSLSVGGRRFQVRSDGPAWPTLAAGTLLGGLAVLAAVVYARARVRRFRAEARHFADELTHEAAAAALEKLAAAGSLRRRGDADGWYRELEGVLEEFLRRRFSARIVSGEPGRPRFAASGMTPEQEAEAGSILAVLSAARFGGFLPDGMTGDEVEKRLKRFVAENSTFSPSG